MSHTQWWKCDLQIATPAWNFHFPKEATYGDLSLAGPARVRFLDDYMRTLRAAGIQVIALADHNTGAWIDDVKAAGQRHGVIVFPGCEITSGTGADGAHLLIIGGLDKTSQDFDRMIHGPLGFCASHPAFHQSIDGRRTPGSSPKTIVQILEDLPDGYLVIAPHALGENGLASRSTARGDIRWKALHHERLLAIDPGNCANPMGDSFNAKFRRRELADFPRLPDLAFVSTSDAYSFADVGKSYTWIRMGDVSLEALRQAFIDHESRILCDWSPRLSAFVDGNPNNIRHAWISVVELGGELGNSSTSLSIPLHPGLNVIIGGRGSGKSTIVAALRELYSETDTLPHRLREEAELFSETVFGGAELCATHRIQESQEEQSARWTRAAGSVTLIDEQEVPTSFRATIINQKELFERAAGDRDDPHLSSRSLLALVDSSIGLVASDTRSVESYGRQLNDARVEWADAVRDLVVLEDDLSQLPALRQQAHTLQNQVDAFSSPEVKRRLARIDARRAEKQALEISKTRLVDAIDSVRKAAKSCLPDSPSLVTGTDLITNEYARLAGRLGAITTAIAEDLSRVADHHAAEVHSFDESLPSSPWHEAWRAAEDDFSLYKAELQEKGLSASEFNRLQEELVRTRAQVESLERRSSEVDVARTKAAGAWLRLWQLLDVRRTARNRLLQDVSRRSGQLRFTTQPFRDTGPWIESLRSMAGFRADAYLEEVPKLASWLWDGPEDSLDIRWGDWRNALCTSDLSIVQNEAQLRSAFVQRLSSLDEVIRFRLASLAPDDVVAMEFLRDGGDPGCASDWQSIVRGSPGQRTAAMLAFVLHHGLEPLVLDQPEDDLDSEWIAQLVVQELRKSRWHRQLIVITHNANIPVLGDAEQVISLENLGGALTIRSTEVIASGEDSHRIQHIGPIEDV